MAITQSKNWPCGYMACKNHKFTLEEDGTPKTVNDLQHGRYVRIKTHYTTHPNYEYAYSSDEGWIYFDVKSENEKQLWKIHKNGAKVAFESKMWPGNYIGTYF